MTVPGVVEGLLDKPDRAAKWTIERLGRMTVQEIKQLRENAERLNETAVAALCSEALKGRPRAQPAARRESSPRTRARHLIARIKAFEARGVYLQDAAKSWSGVRARDGGIVFALWAGAVLSAGGTCSYLLWAPNIGGARPWSDKPAGQERLRHCVRALDTGRAEGLLVYGEALDGYVPEDKAYTVRGVDAEVILALQVRLRDEQYWAVWGNKVLFGAGAR
jgi:hypothetical protein